ncbi:MAG: glycoside hydrolase family 36 N-terminal domain-containing protein, partial [Candidatus Ornithospirochaeta sp.]|nr:glycoside hydrolase family 36 N-terminal domain-containing protein [Candidatus Ornithospirochaeta sp.]
MIEASNGLFTLHGDNYTYQIAIDRFGRLLHLYYGRRINGDASSLLSYRDRGFSACPYEAGTDRTFSYDYLPLEVSTLGDGDFRTPGIIIEQENGALSSAFIYRSHRIYRGSRKLENLPSVCIEDAEVLEITLEDELSKADLILTYIVKGSSLVRGMRIAAKERAITIRK